MLFPYTTPATAAAAAVAAVTWAFGRIKEEMEARYDESGYGWDDADVLEQLRAPEGR